MPNTRTWANNSVKTPRRLFKTVNDKRHGFKYTGRGDRQVCTLKMCAQGTLSQDVWESTAVGIIICVFVLSV